MMKMTRVFFFSLPPPFLPSVHKQLFEISQIVGSASDRDDESDLWRIGASAVGGKINT